MLTMVRTKDVVTLSSNLEEIHSIGDFPIFMGCVNHGRDEDLTCNLTWQISKDSGLIQLKNLIPLDILYQEQHAGAIGHIWAEHHKRFAKFLNKHSPTSVLELGGAHGILSKEYKQYEDIPWTILEPNPTPIEGCSAKFIKGFFDEKFSFDEPFNTIVHSHVFEHIYEPDMFMEHLAKFMGPGKRLTFSLPNMQKMLMNKYTNCINFEHTVWLTEPYVEFLLAKHGFRITEKEYFFEDHSIFFSAIRDVDVAPIKLPLDLYEKNRKVYQDYIDYHHELIINLNRSISGSTSPVYIFGAHVFSQYLIVNGLNTNNIAYILDNDPNKQGKRLYGTNLYVRSPKVLKNLSNPIVVLKAGVYTQEIKEDILNNINPTTIFLE
jgi:hypothetical protein